ncbi:hypothetical protein AAULR_16254 [Lacticaseibacillus rhamnosus MTCC 5462]|nr:hypothetical protein AAULR_16254 [Lacticaseibacillus rhamnosus MTCC 5462]
MYQTYADSSAQNQRPLRFDAKLADRVHLRQILVKSNHTNFTTLNKANIFVKGASLGLIIG